MSTRRPYQWSLACLALLACDAGGGGPVGAARPRTLVPPPPPSQDAGSGGTGGASGPDAASVGGAASTPCAPYDRPPYGTAPYQGVHAGPGNNDLVACDTAAAFDPVWHALAGYGVAQPNTFSPDARTLYVTTTQPTPGACSLHALDAETGAVRWCVAVPGAVGASADVDADGHVYLAAKGRVVSFTAEGAERWSLALEAAPDEAAYGSHFGPGGHLVTATSAGRLLFLDRADGHVVAALDLPTAFGLKRPEAPPPALDLARLLPAPVLADMRRVYGEGDALLAVFGGAGAGYTDNTVGIAPDGTVYAVGWGVADGQGAVVQVRVAQSGDALTLTPGWRLDTVKGSASSPAISPDGRWLKVTDGNATAALLAPAAFPGTARLADIAACDANTDADPAPEVCRPALEIPLASGPALGASPVLDDAEHYLWEVQLATLVEPNTVPDLVRYAGDRVVWATHLPDDAAWTSVLTVTRDAIVGTMSRVTRGDSRILSVPLPQTVTSELAVLDRETGALRFSAPVPDDSTSTVTVGPDGALYATLLGLVSAFAHDTQVVGGVVKYAPRTGAATPRPGPAEPAPLPSTGTANAFLGAPWVGGGFPGSSPPRHPHMAANGRSNIHDDAFMTDAYDAPGPRGRAPVVASNRLGGLCGTIVFDRRGRVLSACISPQSAALYLLDPETLGVLAEHPLPPRGAAPDGGNPLQDFTGGGYFYLDADDRAVISTGAGTLETVAIVDAPEGPRLETVEVLDLRPYLGPEERLTGALPDWHGRQWFVGRTLGVVGVIDGDDVQTLTLGEPVQNSFAVDTDGSVFVVTDAALYRLEAPTGGPPGVVWRETYPNAGVRKPGQAAPGSGTTPTLMDDDLVAIADNADPMDVVVYRRAATVDGPREVCRVPVFDAGAGATENSLIASDRSLFVENNSGYEGLASVTGRTTTPGFARVDVRPDLSGCELVWRNDAVTAPSVVPKLSRATGLIYTYTKAADTDAWYWTALDAASGDVAWQALAGVGSAFNNNYAGLALGPDGAAYLGVLLGMVRLADTPAAAD